MPARNQLAQNFRIFLQLIETAKKKYSVSQPVSLLVVSKTHTLEKLLELEALGQHDFAENYLNEALAKINSLSEINKINQQNAQQPHKIDWHFIGHLQSNKAKLAAQHFSWVHSIDSLKLANALNAHRATELGPLNILIQVNIQGDENKYGVDPYTVRQLAAEITKLPNLKLRGLMCILQQDSVTFDEQFKAFATLKSIFLTLNNNNFRLDTLSMGMSADYQAAIAAGSTMIRIGSAIMGNRS